ncbi:hypothetical protein [Hymenobacter chitinivorans]|uniref:Uncharacterized protein n=1 Tax=Hymenobacter chitinivorans DSM 11115 TaxID=1121954 RepID=A0A2M9BRC0_9BACT|nr:hypothetical protein [Hymenobacter chitinivorans]PJJ60504.1 hypothetical protein CLV45_1933 [Hymenobacter chitinivorans DSM 11115]
MRWTLYVLLGLSSACQPTEFRACPNLQTDPTKQLYQDVVTELIEHGLDHAYLPEQQQQVLWQHLATVDHPVPTATDTAWHQEQEARFQNQLFQDTAHFQTFYLNTTYEKGPVLADLPAQLSTLPPSSRVAGLLRSFAALSQQAVADSLRHLQRRLQAADFQLCTATLRAAEPAPAFGHSPGRGTLSLSKVVFNARRDQALLAYGWTCGPRCGFGEVLWVEKTKGRWRIRQAEMTWIS